MSTAIVEVDAFTSPVVVPEAGDDRTAASIVPAFQALTDRTLHHENKINALGAGPANEYTYNPARQKLFVVPIGLGTVNNPGEAKYDPAVGWSFYTPDAAVLIPLELPSGTRLDGIEATVDNQGSSAQPVVIELRRVTPNFAAPGAPTLGAAVNISNTTVISGPAAAGNLALTAVANNTASHLQIRLLAGGGDFATARGKVMGVRLTVTDYGPRNF